MIVAIATLIVAVVFGLGRVVEGIFHDTCNQIGSNTNGGVPPAVCQ